jgi:hypothetical protein
MESVGGSATSMSFSAVADVFPVEPTVVVVGVEKKDITQSTQFQENVLWGVSEEERG